MLSDGNIIIVALNVSVASVLFQPSVIGKEASGVHNTSFHNFMKCDVGIREILCVHVMLPVGTTMFFEHITKEFTVLPPSTMKIKVFTQYGLEDSSQHIPAGVDLEGKYDDLVPLV